MDKLTQFEYVDKGLKVKVIKTLGSPLSVRNSKYRIGSYNYEKKIGKEIDRHAYNYGERCQMRNVDTARLTSFNILKHPKATEKQKEMARLFLDKFEKYRYSVHFYSFAIAINRVGLGLNKRS